MINVDLHIHTHYSADSLTSPKLVLRTAHYKGIRMVAITDHNTITGAIQAKKGAPDDVEVIIGSETMTEFGEVIGLFLQEDICTHHFFEVIDSIRDQGGISTYAHPFRKLKDIDSHLLDSCDVIEGWNGRTKRINNLRAMEAADYLKKPVVADSDSHFPFELGDVGNLVHLDDGSDMQEQLRKQILCGHVNPFIGWGYPTVGMIGSVLSGGIKKVSRWHNDSMKRF